MTVDLHHQQVNNVNKFISKKVKGPDSSAIIATGYLVDSRGSIAGRGEIFFSDPQRLDRLWGPPRFFLSLG
jgi:hypothetical protein